MATAPRPGAGRRAEADETTLTVILDGVPHVFRPNEVTARLAGQLRKASGMSVAAVMRAAAEDPDLDVVAAVVWLARRQAGENVTFDAVADAITYESTIETIDEAPPEADDPET